MKNLDRHRFDVPPGCTALFVAWNAARYAARCAALCTALVVAWASPIASPLAMAAGAVATPAARAGSLPVYGYQVVRAYPHDPGAFTEGLFIRNGYVYESTGLVGRSSVRKVALESGQVLQRVDLPSELFGEGIVDWHDRLVGLTWQSQTGFVLDLNSFAVRGRFGYAGEGWGLTRNDRELIMSDGTDSLRFLDPETLREVRRLRVSADGVPVTQLNELEWVDGEVFANIWQTDRIARIDPVTGKVRGWIDLTGLLPAQDRGAGNVDVLNGIAYDAKSRRLFVTGKLWPKLFEIRLVAPSGSAGGAAAKRP